MTKLQSLSQSSGSMISVITESVLFWRKHVAIYLDLCHYTLHEGNQFRLKELRILSIAILNASITVLVKQDPWYIGITQVFIAAG